MVFDEVVIKNYGCIRDLELKLAPIHAFIGPNDSGKSTVLRAVRTALQFAGGTFQPDGAGKLQPFDPGISREQDARISLGDSRVRAAYEIVATGGAVDERILFDGEPALSERRSGWNERGVLDGLQTRRPFRATYAVQLGSRKVESGGIVMVDPAESAKNGLTTIQGFEPFFPSLRQGSRLLRLDPDTLRHPSGLNASKDASFDDEHGLGLPGILDALRDRDDDSYPRIRDDFLRLFPAVKLLQLRAVTDATKEVAIELRDGRRVPVMFMSEGMLYYLAFATLPYLRPAAAILIEEPENGLHPARIADVMAVLREVSKTTQVLIATHSPLVVNELQGDEVSVVTRTEAEGTQAVLLKDTPNFEERAKVYALGELWVSYADGLDEAALREGGPPP
jgi:energy-coupling factor transporter ATP-binding protein EcfA2